MNAEKTASKKNWIDGKSILGAPAAKLRKTLADASSRRRDVQGITRRIEERTALAGRRSVGLISGSAIAFASANPHLPEPASGGNVWFWFRSCDVS